MPKKGSQKNNSKTNGIVKAKAIVEESVEEVSSTTNETEIIENIKEKPGKRGRKPAAPKATAETVTESVETEHQTAAEPKKSTRRGAKTQKGDVNPVEDEDVPKPKTKGKSVRNKKEPVEEENVEANVLDIAENKSKAKGRQKKTKTAEAETETEVKETNDEIVEKPKGKGRAKKAVSADTASEKKSPPAKRGKKAETKAKVESDVPTVKSDENKKGRKKIVKNVEEENELEIQIEVVSINENKGKKTKAATTKKKNETTESPEEELQPMVEKSNDIEPVKNPRGRKRAPAKIDDNESTEKPAKSRRLKKDTEDSNGSAGLVNSVDTDYKQSDFDFPIKDTDISSDEKPFNLKISSWNVAGLRSWLKKNGLKFLEYEQPDVFCIQETKCTTDQLPDEARIPGYHPYWLCMPGGYAGVALYSKIMPIHVDYGIGDKEFDENGRMITAEYEKFYLINVYVPNSGRGLVNLNSRMRWELLFQEYIKKLDKLKPVVICGDMNCSHTEIDLANPKTNTRSAGFTKEEREKMTEMLALGFVDTFRHLYPDKTGAYTYWTYMSNARARNVGWRLDYFIVSERFMKRVVDNLIRSQVKGSDHCPITLFLQV